MSYTESHIDRAARYGVTSSNPLEDPSAYHASFNPQETVDWTDKRLMSITRLRILGLGDYGCPFVDVSYCHGVLKDGTQVVVELGGRWQFPKRTWKTAIINAAKADRVYAKGLGLFDAVDIL